MYSKEQLLACLDVTILKEPVTEKDVKDLLEKIIYHKASVASVCLPYRFAKLVKSYKDFHGAFCSVLNFPSGSEDEIVVNDQLSKMIVLGADEIDYVMDYKKLQKSSEFKKHITNQISSLKSKCPVSTVFKVIMETGELESRAQIMQAVDIVASAGADFAKTSTGMSAKGASLEAVAAIIDGVKAYREKINKPDFKIGIKISGGVRSIQQAVEYIDLVAAAFGKEFIHPKTFRIGASQLFNEILDI